MSEQDREVNGGGVNVETAIGGLGGLGAGAGIFLSEHAKNANLEKKAEAEQLYAQLGVFEEPDMEKRLNMKEAVWKQTGWFMSSRDQQWRFEVPIAGNTYKFRQAAGLGPNDLLKATTAGQLQDFGTFPDIFAAEPGLERMPVEQSRTLPKSVYGTSGFSSGVKINAETLTPAEAIAALEHEVPHVISGIHSQPTGTNPIAAALKSPATEAKGIAEGMGPGKAYLADPGEAFSRLSEDRARRYLAGDKGAYDVFPLRDLENELKGLNIEETLEPNIRETPSSPANFLPYKRQMGITGPGHQEVRMTVPDLPEKSVAAFLKTLIKRSLR